MFFDELTKTHGHIYVVEEHSEIGGLGDALSYLGARNIAIPDRILYEGGDVNHLRKLTGIDSESIYRRVKQEVVNKRANKAIKAGKSPGKRDILL